MVKIELINDLHTRIVLKLNALTKRLPASVAAMLQGYLYKLAGQIQSEKMSGQLVNVKTGLLRGSVHANPVTVTPEKIVGEIIGGEPPALYGKWIEAGASPHEIVAGTNKRALSFILDGRARQFARVSHTGVQARWFFREAAREAARGLSAGFQTSLDEEIKK
jgi:hypothetical protein